MKTCVVCEIKQPLEAYARGSGYKGGRRTRCKACDKEYRESYIKNNPEYRQKQREYKRQWRKDKSEIHCKNQADRRARKLKQTPNMCAGEHMLIESLYFAAKILSNSCGESFHVDHITPLVKGGLHCWDNLQLLSAEENFKKGGR